MVSANDICVIWDNDFSWLVGKSSIRACQPQSVDMSQNRQNWILTPQTGYLNILLDHVPEFSWLDLYFWTISGNAQQKVLVLCQDIELTHPA